MTKYVADNDERLKGMRWSVVAVMLISATIASAAVGLGGADSEAKLEQTKLSQIQHKKSQLNDEAKKLDFDQEKAQLRQSLKEDLLAEHVPTGQTHETDLRGQIFAKMTNNLMPMSPEQIATLRELYNRTNKASAQVGLVRPKPTSTSKVVDLSPGARPALICLCSGYLLLSCSF